MQEKLSIKKVYRNAYRYVASHLFAFAFLTIFYFFLCYPYFISIRSKMQLHFLYISDKFLCMFSYKSFFI